MVLTSEGVQVYFVRYIIFVITPHRLFILVHKTDSGIFRRITTAAVSK
jgi:hypothetical protein